MDRNPKGSTLVLVLLVFVFMAAHESNGWSLIAQIRKLVQDNGPSNITNNNNNNKNNKSLQISPSPAPGPASDGVSIRSCTSSLKTCGNKNQINIRACLISSPNANTELCLIIQNDGESFLKVNVSTTKSTSQIIPMAKGDIKKVNVSDGRSSSIVLNVDDGACVIRFESPSPDNYFLRRFPYYAGAATPLNGVFLLLLGALVFGGTWACCMLGKKGHHVDGVPYQELEMGRPESPSGVNKETLEHWDQGWDDEWGDTKEVRSPKGSQNGNASRNNSLRASRSSDKDGWENTWDD